MILVHAEDMEFLDVYWTAKDRGLLISLDFVPADRRGRVCLWFSSEEKAEEQLAAALAAIRTGRDPRSDENEGFFRYASGDHSCKHLDNIEDSKPDTPLSDRPVLADDRVPF